MSTETLELALATIASERGQKFDQSFEKARAVLAEYGELDLADRLMNDLPSEWDWRDVADLLGILQWLASDNGRGIALTAERWLEERTDLSRIQVALNLDTLPFDNLARMESALHEVAAVFPGTQDRCRELIEERRRQGE